MRKPPLALAVMSVFLLSGCALIPFLSSREPSLRGESLMEIVTSEDAPDGTPFDADPYRNSFASVKEYADSVWYDEGGIPQTCFGSFALSYLVSPVDDGTRDPFINVGQFRYEYESAGVLGVSARLFKDTDSAYEFLDFVSEASLDCQFGYQLTSIADDGWRVEHVEAVQATDLDLPSGVAVIHHRESLAEILHIEYRATFVQYANAIVLITCEVHQDGPFGFDECDELAEVVARRMVDAG